jgi:hypothetical protein
MRFSRRFSLGRFRLGRFSLKRFSLKRFRLGRFRLGRSTRGRLMPLALAAACLAAASPPLSAEPVFSDRIAALSDLNQRRALAGFFQGTGKTCRVVRRAFYQGKDAKGVGYFNVACEIDAARTMADYVLVMANTPSGGVRIMECLRARMITQTPCWQKLVPAP